MKYYPDGTVEGTVEEIVAYKQAISSTAKQKPPPAPALTAAPNREINGFVVATTRQADERDRRARAHAFIEAMSKRPEMTSADLSRAINVPAGKGLGSALGQIKRTIAKRTNVPWDQLIHQERSPNRKVGMILKVGGKFHTVAPSLLEDLR